MKKLLFVLLVFTACKSEDNSKNSHSSNNTKSEPNVSVETKQMAKTLAALNDNEDPTGYLHWNTKLANFYKKKISKDPSQDRMKYWFQYCSELLRAGDNKSCINEIENLISLNNTTYDKMITKESLPVVELLALAYLRLGEVSNCKKYHNEYSCILPLKDEAHHIETHGSKKAIEIYSNIDKKFPNDKYKWLANLAHMTLGGHPQSVPQSLLINYPNWKKEKKDFPAFKEIALNLGVAVDGLSGGVCLEDFNNDGLMDIFATSYGMEDQCKLFYNTGDGFLDVTEKAGLSGIVSGLNCIHADYDNDGNVDILILRGAWLGESGIHPNSLLKNNGDGTFSDVTKSAGLLSFHPTQTASWADVNKDGYLDLFIGNESKINKSHPCELYINQKNGKFLEQSASYNLGSIAGFVKGVVFGDINNDQWPDLYISMLGGRNLLFKNDSGKFTNISKSAGVEEPIQSFPCWFWDVNNDGFNDIFVSSYDSRNLTNVSDDFAKEVQGKKVSSEKSRLFINNGDETFKEQSVSYNISKSMYTMGSNFGDIDNDGWLDFYIGTGAPDYNSVIPNRMFRNVNGVKFEEVTSSGRFGHIQKGHGIGFADLDNDGDQDIYAVMGGAYEGDKFTNVCFENPISENNWIVIDLVGTNSNHSALGSVIKLVLDNDKTIYHTISTGGSFGSSSLQAEIGLGKCKSVKELIITWPNSKTQIFRNLPIDKKYKIIEGKDNIDELKYSKINFKMNDAAHHHHH